MLSLDAPLGTYLPPFKGRPAPRVRDVLCHASGLPVFKLNMLLNARPGTLTLADLASGIAERPLLEEPGKRFVWAFNNDELAGLVLETVTGKPYPALLSEWILKPLGMARTGVGLVPEGQAVAWETRLAEFRKNLALWKGSYRCSVGLYSTLEDLDRFFDALSGGRLVSARAYQDMQAPYVKDGAEGAALGFNVAESGVLHNGGDDGSGFYAVFWYDPRHDLRILALGNRWMDLEGRSLRKVLVPEVYASLGLRE
ncbi:MAG TPA: serine hydrolase domain-containing protein [Holophaga sp.]|nr:serine hydrolase domain-containing protein [Holophaga sp.]